MPKFFDIHSHINDSKFEFDITETITRMSSDDVWTIVVGTDSHNSQLAVQISNFYDGVFASIGIHPADDPNARFDPDFLTQLASSKKVVAIGECGLDYLRGVDISLSEKKRQMDLFEAQLELAVKIEKPIMVHCRDAHSDMINILLSKKKEYGDALRGNIHFFAGSVEEAKKYFELGFTISFTGVITFASDYDDVVKYAPLDMIMSETDSPYVAPVPYRGNRNEPVYVKEVVKRIADIRGEDLVVVQQAMVDNAMRVFEIGK